MKTSDDEDKNFLTEDEIKEFEEELRFINGEALENVDLRSKLTDMFSKKLNKLQNNNTQENKEKKLQN